MLSGHPHAASGRHAVAQALQRGAISFDAVKVKMLLLMRSDKMAAFREAVELSIAVLITGIGVGLIAYAGAQDRFAIKLSPSQTYPLSLASDYEVVGINPTSGVRGTPRHYYSLSVIARPSRHIN